MPGPPFCLVGPLPAHPHSRSMMHAEGRYRASKQQPRQTLMVPAKLLGQQQRDQDSKELTNYRPAATSTASTPSAPPKSWRLPQPPNKRTVPEWWVSLVYMHSVKLSPTNSPQPTARGSAPWSASWALVSALLGIQNQPDDLACRMGWSTLQDRLVAAGTQHHAHSPAAAACHAVLQPPNKASPASAASCCAPCCSLLQGGGLLCEGRVRPSQ